MQISDFWRMITDLESRSPEHALMLLNAPTGTGKSYTIAQALCQYAADHENFRAFFVTDQKRISMSILLKQPGTNTRDQAVVLLINEWLFYVLWKIPSIKSLGTGITNKCRPNIDHQNLLGRYLRT
ncbi:DEAD/DEAH box helicase family protein [Lacticaseibacillus paracasei]|nr:DEAD/DEAH box helicase family protein [Lacticaseibacillus paracasei]